MNMNNVAEMKMFFGVTREAWLSMTKGQRLAIMKREMRRINAELKKYA